jgi:hypothetical protein
MSKTVFTTVRNKFLSWGRWHKPTYEQPTYFKFRFNIIHNQTYVFEVVYYLYYV